MCLYVTRTCASPKHDPILKFRVCLYSVSACVCVHSVCLVKDSGQQGTGWVQGRVEGMPKGRNIVVFSFHRGVLSACT